MVKELSVFDIRATDEKKEEQGIWVDYGPFAFKVRRMGPGNLEFTKMTEKALRPYQSAIRANTMDEKLARKILVEVFCKTVLVAWRKTITDPNTGEVTYAEGLIPDGKGGDIEYTLENAIETLTKARGALDDLIERASSLENFKADEVEETVKN